jgi:hypothetical protein
MFIVTNSWKRGPWRGVTVPISQPKFWLSPSVEEHKFRRLNVYSAQIIIPFSVVLLLVIPSAWNPIFPAKK